MERWMLTIWPCCLLMKKVQVAGCACMHVRAVFSYLSLHPRSVPECCRQNDGLWRGVAQNGPHGEGQSRFWGRQLQERRPFVCAGASLVAASCTSCCLTMKIGMKAKQAGSLEADLQQGFSCCVKCVSFFTFFVCVSR